MASILDEHMARRGTIRPGAEGINIANAADRHWVREETETERDFLGRVRAEAKAEGYRTVALYGAINVAEE